MKYNTYSRESCHCIIEDSEHTSYHLGSSLCEMPFSWVINPILDKTKVINGNLRKPQTDFQFLFPISIKRGYTEFECPSSASLNTVIDLQYTTKIRDPTQLETSRWPSILRDGSWYSRSAFY